MLYYLFRYLGDLGITGSNLWHYISFRSVLALVLSLIISMWFGEYFIKWMKKHNVSEAQRDAGTDPYNQDKVGVPPMGGIVIILATLIPALLFGRLRNIYMLMMIATMLWLGFVGFVDDYLKYKTRKYNSLPLYLRIISSYYTKFRGKSTAEIEEYLAPTDKEGKKKSIEKNGMRAPIKLFCQFVLGIVIGLTLWMSPDAVICENIQDERQGMEQVVTHKSEMVKSTITTIPFVKNNNLNYANFFKFLGKYRTAAGWIFFVLLTTFIVMAVSNGSNLNDGMDGMCAGNAAIMCTALGVLAYVSSHIHMAAYLNIMFVPGSEELVIFICAFVGALIGFLWYNAYPAQVFMGDTGSLAIGGIIGVTAVIIHKELLLPVLCFVFLAESVSVILQHNYAKLRNTPGHKKLIFKRAPIHDTFRFKPEQMQKALAEGTEILLKNWPKGYWHEVTVTARFWIVTIIMAALAIVTLKIR